MLLPLCDLAARPGQVERLGYKALVVTVDAPRLGRGALRHSRRCSWHLSLLSDRC